ncbi:hypothetical protein AXG93_810s1010 [Marchantia polymorpha subsp. ruderalis]|uniref:Uncharacterized protein n=1 Tax=Marchantia polymorpha subsp. ruderalis TaxID=1480154 RepID=A0A176W9G8_MARPO|nr:hypothetical protein AXG93_810s1010 [Marchantia polymorpha subsp. ruderalis]
MDKWMEDRRLQGSEATGNSDGHYAHPQTGANDLCHGLASGVLSRSHEGAAGALGKNLYDLVWVEEPGLPPPEEEVRMKTSNEEVKTLEVTFPDFLQDSVVPLLKYLNRKRKKYAVSKEEGFYVQLVRNRTKIKRAVAVKRE